jgi:hypothetical protein
MMFQNAALTVGLVSAALVGLVAAVDETTNPERIAQLVAANSHLDQQAILGDDLDWHFDFTRNKNYNFAPGGVANMNAATFPAAKIGGMTSEHPPAAHLLFCIHGNRAPADHHRLALSGNAQPGPLLDAPTALAPERGQLRRGRLGQHHHVHVPRERRPAGHAGLDPGPRHHLPAGFDAHDDEHWCVCDALFSFFPSLFPSPPFCSQSRRTSHECNPPSKAEQEIQSNYQNLLR